MTMYVDPPELQEHAARGDPPVDSWPGRTMGEEDVMKASGDRRDWFRFHHRRVAAERAWDDFSSARTRRENDVKAGFDWNQILVLGDYGAKKTTAAIHLARHYFGQGHAVFSNASCLFGWRLEREQMYTAIGFMPKNSVLLIDESSAALSSRVGHGIAVSSFGEMNLNVRKQNCIVLYVSAQDWQIAPTIRRDCKEVWMPVKSDELEIVDAATSRRLVPGNDPNNFRMAWHVWDDYPYRKANLIEGPDPAAQNGFGPPAYTMYDDGKNVRRAYLLNDTFELAQAGAATTADREIVKDELRAFQAGSGPSGAYTGSTNTNGSEDPATARDKALAERLMAYFLFHEDDPPEYFWPGDIAKHMGLKPGHTGSLVQTYTGARLIRNYGYPSAEIYASLQQAIPR